MTTDGSQRGASTTTHSGRAALRRLSTAASIRQHLRKLGDADDANFLQRFFRTGPGQYGEGDRFLGVRVPAIRRVAREARGLPLEQIERLLEDRWHEVRLLAVILYADAYKHASPAQRTTIFRSYLRHSSRINNWDLVDVSASNVVGAHLLTRPRGQLDRLARSRSLWKRRIAIIATQAFIRNGEFDDTLRIAHLLMHDPHDLIHKAVGWMLREVGNRDRATLESFLEKHAHEMPRTMLRYAIEKLPAIERKRFMAARVAPMIPS
ncbi:MAG: DNA alkylation repair protein [Deltaproteobacteria bacterium]